MEPAPQSQDAILLSGYSKIKQIVIHTKLLSSFLTKSFKMEYPKIVIMSVFKMTQTKRDFSKMTPINVSIKILDVHVW